MLHAVEPDRLFLAVEANANRGVDDREDEVADGEGPQERRRHAHNLHAHLRQAEAGGVEQARGDGAPGAGQPVHGDGPHRVVDVPLQRAGAIDHDGARDGPREDGVRRREGRAPRGNADQPAQHAVQRHRGVRRATVDPGDGHSRHRPSPRRDERVHGNLGDRGGPGRRGARVKAEPPEPQDKHPQRRQGKAVPRNAARRAVVRVLAHAGSHDQRPGQRRPAANAVHDCRSGKVDEAERLQPAASVEQAAPRPRSKHRIDEPRDGDGKDQVAAKLDALGDRAGDNGGRRGRKNRLEEVKGVDPSLRLIARAGEEEAVGANEAAPGGAEHQPKSDREEDQRPGRGVHHVLHDDVHRVFRPREAGLQQRKARLHEEDQRRGEDRPDVIQVRLRLLGRLQRLGNICGVRQPAWPQPQWEPAKDQRRKEERCVSAFQERLFFVVGAIITPLTLAMLPENHKKSSRIEALPMGPEPLPDALLT